MPRKKRTPTLGERLKKAARVDFMTARQVLDVIEGRKGKRVQDYLKHFCTHCGKREPSCNCPSFYNDWNLTGEYDNATT